MKIALVHILSTCLLLLCAIGCNEKKLNSREKYFTNNVSVDASNIPLDSTQNYYPYDVFTDTSMFVGSDTFLITWYSRHLFALQEPLIFNKPSAKEIYRFTWLRSFHNPIAVRIEKGVDNIVHLFWKQSDGSGGYEPGKIVVNNSKRLNLRQWNKFTSIIDSIDYWNLKTNDTRIGNDGARWVLEGAFPEKYHVVDRWSVRNNSTFHNACKYLIELTGLKISERDIY